MVRVVDASTCLDDVLQLVTGTARREPWWLPTVDTADGAAVRVWFGRKDPWIALAARDDLGCVGYLAVRDGATALVSSHLDQLDAPGGWAELCRAVVSPDRRRQGVLSSLVAAAAGHPDVAGRRLWLTCVQGSGAHAAWRRLGFADVATVTFPADVDDRPGVVCVRDAP